MHREDWPLNALFFSSHFLEAACMLLENNCFVETGFKSSPAMYWLCLQTSYLTFVRLSFFICKGAIMPMPKTVEELSEIMYTWPIELFKYGATILPSHMCYENLAPISSRGGT